MSDRRYKCPNKSCPVNFQIHTGITKKCPKCGTELVPVESKPESG